MCRNLSLRNPTALDTLHNDDGDFSAFFQDAWPFRSSRYHDTNEEGTFRLQDAKLGASTCLMSSLCPCLRPALPRASEQPRSREPVSPLLSLTPLAPQRTLLQPSVHTQNRAPSCQVSPRIPTNPPGPGAHTHSPVITTRSRQHPQRARRAAAAAAAAHWKQGRDAH